MSPQKLSSFSFLFLLKVLIFLLHSTSSASTAGDFPNSSLKRFIISVRRPAAVSHEKSREWHESLLSQLTAAVVNSAAGDTPSAIPRLLHSYTNLLSGFSARLSADELNTISKMDWFINAIPDPVYKLHTTHSPEFLGLLHSPAGAWNDSKQGEGIIIGLLDSGITANHPSFSDQGVPPPPPKWKGKCTFPKPLCNNKLIGAQSFIFGEPDGTPPDDHDGDGHGTHTASTAAGTAVSKAASFGNAAGTAVGMAPRAHIAAYRVCTDDACYDACYGSNILAGMDAAIHDRVDVLSISLGGDADLDFYQDPMAISAFTATSIGIFVSVSAGNDGPEKGTVTNAAPWMLTVGASTMDRRIAADVRFKGESLNQIHDSPARNPIPLVFPGINGDEKPAACSNGSLAGFDVRGKVVVCLRGVNGRVEKGEVVKAAGGAAMILMNTNTAGYTTIADGHVLPASHVSHEDGIKIVEYINTTETATASISFRGTEFRSPFSPSVGDFSSRGPGTASPGILKPDITGPGVSVLAAWHELDPANKKPTFKVLSGTSMSCPHLSGIAALLKAAHMLKGAPRDWSPAAIKSALLTTADVVDRSGKPISDEKRKPADFYALGAGHVNPEKAMNPGLVYDLKKEDYFPYFCGLGYDETLISVIVDREVNCSVVGSIMEAELNYPSFSVELGVGERVVLNRTLTNVGLGSQRYWAEIEPPKGVVVKVVPKRLTFKKLKQEKKFRIVLKRSEEGLEMAKGYLKWVSQSHLVRSPILITSK
ncbi:LOW QUALITY PROTEIN: subtilisin-like protease SBT1.2 [Phalaenopsis equestris]|uniref:LOW QUALITY PROTEIN: subtilisin-like protease SBT1.2 n=1 Tax=Phalaenopsis equestris TaxID=78828 RepID=UPI0009E2D3EE|nr:LOW QUALITY PROTEIN: subtilisin-like protease SBT1.2 [Phalaenopsis equestris]